MPTILTLGYGNRDIADFLTLLRRYKIKTLADIRTTPLSRFRPAFSKNALAAALKEAGIDYVFKGDTLGGRPADPACYTDGVVDYAKVHKKPFFRRGLDELIALSDKAGPVAIMCAELEPQRCHRALMVAGPLIDRGVEVRHIDERGELITQDVVESRIGPGGPTLFTPGADRPLSKKPARRAAQRRSPRE